VFVGVSVLVGVLVGVSVIVGVNVGVILGVGVGLGGKPPSLVISTIGPKYSAILKVPSINQIFFVSFGSRLT
jgi:hypothetical protein